METANLPPHKAAAARRQAEKEKAELDRLVGHLPPHKAAAARKEAARKKEGESKVATDQVQAAAKHTPGHQQAALEKVKPQEKPNEASPPFQPTKFVVPELLSTEDTKETTVPEIVTTMVVFAEAPAGNEHDMTVALTDIAEIERDIELAKEKENSEAVMAMVLYDMVAAEDHSCDTSADEQAIDPIPPDACLRLLVEDIHPDINKECLMALFRTIGPVALITMERGRAFVICHHLVHAIAAVDQFHGQPANGQAISVSFSKRTQRTLFREGNYQIPLSCIMSLLKQMGLWYVVSEPMVDITGPTAKLKNDWAVNHIMSFVCERFWEELELACPASGYQLLVLLREKCQDVQQEVCQPSQPGNYFRLMDLDLRIRTKIYKFMAEPILIKEMALGTAKVQISSYIEKEDWFKPRSEWTMKYRGRNNPYPKHPLFRMLFSISREFHQALWKILFSHLDLSISACNLEEVEAWVAEIGMWRLRQLRSLHLDMVRSPHECTEHFFIKHDPKEGLQATCYSETNGPVDLTRYVAMLERRKVEEQWESTGVIEFFTADHDALRFAMGLRCYESNELEKEEVNERDAYQVAYGRCVKRLVRPRW